MKEYIGYGGGKPKVFASKDEAIGYVKKFAAGEVLDSEGFQVWVHWPGSYA
jgi:hypothetical protein